LLVHVLLIKALLAEAWLIEPSVAETLATLVTDGALTKTLIEAPRVAALIAEALVAEPTDAETLIAKLSVSKSPIVLAAEPLVTESLGALASALTASDSPSRAAEATHRRERVERSGAAVGSAAEAPNGGKWIHTCTCGASLSAGSLSATGDSAARCACRTRG
jgi:hypothetical protein